MITFKTNLGDIKINLDFDNAPVTAKNFQQYAEDGFYNGTIFHRVIKGFMATRRRFRFWYGRKNNA